MSDDCVLVLNAGSSSLKFTVYRRLTANDGDVDASGQSEGIGTSARFKARNGAGEQLADEALNATVKDGRDALDTLARWLSSHFTGTRVLGVGHRIVPGGAPYQKT